MTTPDDSLERFVSAQAEVWPYVVSELRAGYKTSHWMWFVFPQLRGLGFSARSHYYGLADLAEARAYLAHPLLGERLRWATQTVLSHADHAAPEAMLGTIDANKLCSCLTLFAATGSDDLFVRAIDVLFAGEPDPRTLVRLQA